jgi:hypothetical protein
MKRTLLSIIFIALLCIQSFSQNSWIQQGLGFTAASRGVMNVSIANDTVAWVSAYDGSGAGTNVTDYSMTSNGGTTWTPGTINVSGLANSMIFGVSATTAYAALYKATGTNHQGIYKTTNGGTTWTFQSTATFTGSTSFPDWVYFWDENNGCCLGDPNGGHFEVYTTIDGGTTWVAVPASQLPTPLTGETCYTSNVCAWGDLIACGSSTGRVLTSQDKGHHWIAAAPFATTKVPFPAYRDTLYGLALKVQSQADTSQVLQKTTNGGVAFSAVTYHGSPYDGEIHYIPGTTNMFITTGVDATNQSTRLGLTRSTDGGNNWYTDMDPLIYGTQITCGMFNSVYNGWLGSFNGNGTTGDPTIGIYKFNGVWAKPMTNFSTPDTLLGFGGIAHFKNLTQGNQTTYKWSFPGGSPATSTAKTPPAITYAVGGWHNVTLIATNSMGSDTLVKTHYIYSGFLGVNEMNQNAVSVFPNPVKDIMNIKAISNITEINLYNIAGQLVISQMINAKTAAINTSGLSTGVYTLKAILDNGTITKKVVIQ